MASLDIATLSVKGLKSLLDSVGVRHTACREKSELQALALAYPHPFPASAMTGGGSGGGASPAAQPSALAALDGAPLFAALRAIADDGTRRDVTARVHAAKLRAWRASPRFAGMAAHLVDDIHPVFRRGFADVLARSRRDSAVAVAAFAGVNEGLHGHHSLEDASLFPRLRRAHPELARDVDALEADHAELVRLQSRVVSGDLPALQAFVASLEDHLNREEMLLLPALMDGTSGL